MGEPSSSSDSYIHMVQHLIEECIIFKMSKEECMEALSRHANVLPVITSTVWKELEKENKQFFEVYYNNTKTKTGSLSSSSEGHERVSDQEMERQRIQKLLLDVDSNTTKTKPTN